jgi:hypothetical protein
VWGFFDKVLSVVPHFIKIRSGITDGKYAYVTTPPLHTHKIIPTKTTTS